MRWSCQASQGTGPARASRRAVVVVAAVALVGSASTTLLTVPAAASPQRGSGVGARPLRLPLLPGTTGGQVINGSGERTLFGGCTSANGTTYPVVWTLRHGAWHVRDLSHGHTVTGNANSTDRAGDILVYNGQASQAWVIAARDGAARRLRAFDSSASGVVAERINAGGSIAGAVVGPAPDYQTTGAIWPTSSSRPRLEHPLPFSGSNDSLLLGLNDEGLAVGNSNNADFSDFAGGAWFPRSTNGTVLPGLGRSHHSFPLRVNDDDVVVGEAANGDFSTDGAAVWLWGRLLFLGTALPSDNSATLQGVSPNGQAVGVSRAAHGHSARVVYWPGAPSRRLRVLPPLSGTWRTGQANAHYVSNDGLVGGDSVDRAGDDVPVVWPDAKAESVVP